MAGLASPPTRSTDQPKRALGHLSRREVETRPPVTAKNPRPGASGAGVGPTVPQHEANEIRGFF